jgi:protein-disulfide isomerase
VDAVLQEQAKELGVEGTPTLVAADGRKNVGALSGQALQSFIAASPSASPALAGAPTTTSR